MLTPEQIDQIRSDINLAASATAPFAAMLGPVAITALAVGRIVAQEIPATIAVFQRWAAGQKETPEELAAMQAELEILGNPDLP